MGQILVVTEDRAEANSIEQLLRAQNLPVLIFSSPEVAIQSLAATSDSTLRIDVILMDAGSNADRIFLWLKQLTEKMLDRSGQIWSHDRARIPVLLLTHADHVPHALRALQAGAYDYVARPYSSKQLQAAVLRTLEYQRLRVQNDLFRHHREQLITARTELLQHNMQQLESSYDVTLEALGHALDLKDAETEGHSKRVTAYTLALGRAVGLREPELRIAGRGAFLHDIGKMAIPDAILRKPDKLTAEEQAIMRTHSELGYKMIRKIPFLQEAAEIVYSHQEPVSYTHLTLPTIYSV